jgi:hypothetical protein
MPQSCDMGQTALLPLRRKARYGFFRPKNLTASAFFFLFTIVDRFDRLSVFFTVLTFLTF